MIGLAFLGQVILKRSMTNWEDLVKDLVKRLEVGVLVGLLLAARGGSAAERRIALWQKQG